MTHVTDDLRDDLRAMDEDFLTTDPAEKKGISNQVPPGSYQAVIDELYFDYTKDRTKVMLKWELIIAVGPYKGERLTRNNMTETPQNKSWMKADLLSAGLDTEGMLMSELPDHLPSLIDAMLDVTVKKSGEGDLERTNVYINRRIDRGDDEPQPAPRPAPVTPPSRRKTGGTSRGLSHF